MGKAAPKLVSAQNTFTDYVKIDGQGIIDVIDTSSGTMTLTLQKLPYGESTPIDVDTQTAEGVYTFYDRSGSTYRFGCKTGDYTSGDFTVVLTNGGR